MVVVVVVGWKADLVEMEAWAVEGREVEEEVVKRRQMRVARQHLETRFRETQQQWMVLMLQPVALLRRNFPAFEISTTEQEQHFVNCLDLGFRSCNKIGSAPVCNIESARSLFVARQHCCTRVCSSTSLPQLSCFSVKHQRTCDIFFYFIFNKYILYFFVVIPLLPLSLLPLKGISCLTFPKTNSKVHIISKNTSVALMIYKLRPTFFSRTLAMAWLMVARRRRTSCNGDVAAACCSSASDVSSASSISRTVSNASTKSSPSWRSAAVAATME